MDEYVSRTHAALDSVSGQTLVEDLGSSGGTLVNGVPLQGRQPLRHGDLVRFGTVEARYEEPDGVSGQTVISPGPLRSPGPATSPTTRVAAQYNVGYQQAGQLSNVGGNQYNQYIQQVQAERASFIREVAAAKTRARRLIVVGFMLFLAGTGVYFWVGGKAAGLINNAPQVLTGSHQVTPAAPDLRNLLGPNIGGIPLGVIGLAFTFLGIILMKVGLVLHIVAAVRRKHFDRRTHYVWPAVPPPQTW